METRVLVTGSEGFIGKHLCQALSRLENVVFFKYDINSDEEQLIELVKKVDIVYHFASVQRPLENETYEANVELTQKIVTAMNLNPKPKKLIFTSSVQVLIDNDYGKSKLKEEQLILQSNNKFTPYVFRLPNLFGPGSKPNYTSVVATFCYNISRGLECQIHDHNKIMKFLFIDDLIKQFVEIVYDKHLSRDIITFDEKTHAITLKELYDLIINISNNDYKPQNKFENDMKITFESYHE